MPSQGLFPTLGSRPRAKSLPIQIQTRDIAMICRSKLALEADRSEHRLSRLVGHANLLDNLVLKLGEEKEEQRQRVREDSPWAPAVRRSKKVQWIDAIADVLEEEDSADSGDDNDEHDDDPDDYFSPGQHHERRNTYPGGGLTPPTLSHRLTDCFKLNYDDDEESSEDEEAEAEAGESDAETTCAEDVIEGRENLILTRCASHGKPGYTPAADVVDAALSNLQALDLSRSKRTAPIDSSARLAATVSPLGAA